MATRQIIEIDEAKCNGCGQCILDCAEGALEIVNGKAKVVADMLCDGLGACLSGCPEGALKVIMREAPDFDEHAVHARQHQQAKPSPCYGGCPGTAVQQFAAKPLKPLQPMSSGQSNAVGLAESGGAERLNRHWPIKVRLAPAAAPFLNGEHVVIAADCAAPASAAYHRIIGDRLALIACPKFEPREELSAKIRDMIIQSGLKKLDVLRMEVPCCAALTQICRQAAAEAGAEFVVDETILKRDGTVS